MPARPSTAAGGGGGAAAAAAATPARPSTAAAWDPAEAPQSPFRHLSSLKPKEAGATHQYWRCCGLREDKPVCLKAKGAHLGSFRKHEVDGEDVLSWTCCGQEERDSLCSQVWCELE